MAVVFHRTPKSIWYFEGWFSSRRGEDLGTSTTSPPSLVVVKTINQIINISNVISPILQHLLHSNHWHLKRLTLHHRRFKLIQLIFRLTRQLLAVIMSSSMVVGQLQSTHRKLQLWKEKSNWTVIWIWRRGVVASFLVIVMKRQLQSHNHPVSSTIFMSSAITKWSLLLTTARKLILKKAVKSSSNHSRNNNNNLH